MATLGELAEQASVRSWSDKPGYRLVKVVSPSGLNALRAMAGKDPGQRGVMQLGGCFTQERYLYGMTAQQIETCLGLRSGELMQMAYVIALGRLPRQGEYEFGFGLDMPGGEVFEGKLQDKAAAQRADHAAGREHYTRSMVPVSQAYLPGSGMIPQWRLKEKITVPAGPILARLAGAIAFPRENGSIAPYTPHLRGPVRHNLRGWVRFDELKESPKEIPL